MVRRSFGESVDDSEPEREELRRKWHKQDERKQVGDPTLWHQHQNHTEIIEITDDEVDGDAQESQQMKVVDNMHPGDRNSNNHSQFSNEGAYNVIQRHQDSPAEKGSTEDIYISSRKSRTSTSLPNVVFSPPGTSSLRSITPATEESTSSDEEEIGHPKLESNFYQFAYKDANTALAPRNLSKPSFSALPQSPDDRARIPTKKKVACGTAHRFTADFSDAELAKVVKCVGCDVRWTTRKSALQKMLHIQSCTKKHRLTDETVRFLVRREIGQVDLAQDGQANDDPLSGGQDPCIVSKTLFENYVDATASKKKGKTRDISTTIANISDTRSDILARARALLEPVMSDFFITHHEGLPACAWALQQSRPADSKFTMVSTQRFERSTLAESQVYSNGFRSDVDREASDLEDIDVAIETQQFTSSKLGAHHLPLHKSPDASSSAYHYPITNDLGILTNKFDVGTNIHKNTSSHASQQCSSLNESNNSAKDRSPRISTSSKLSIDHFLPYPPRDSRPMTSSQKRTKSKGNAIVILTSQLSDSGSYKGGLYHNEYGVESKNEVLSAEASTRPVACDETDGVITALKESLSCIPAGLVTGYSRPQILPAPTNKSTRETGRFSDDDWENTIKSLILQNVNIHSRILRYEPVSFDIILNLIGRQASVSGSFKEKLRTFLDQQGINFYGFTERRTRRRRRRSME